MNMVCKSKLRYFWQNLECDLSLYENLPDPHFREEIEKQKAKERYMKMHLAGKTDQAKADLARLAIIRKQREEAARKKEEERKGQFW